MKTKIKKVELKNLRILSQVNYFNLEGNRVTLNAGEAVPIEIFTNDDLLKSFIDQGKICEIDAEGHNIEKKNDVDESGREIFDNNFLCGLINPQGISFALRYLQERRLCLKNLKAMAAKVEEVMATIDTPVLEMLRDKISEQIYQIQILDASYAS